MPSGRSRPAGMASRTAETRSHTGSRYASTLWGWQRRWLGGTQAGRAATNEHPERVRLRPNDVAGSVLARRWLSGDRGFGGPVLLYDRILPEFCLACGSKVEPTASTDAAGRTIIRRTPCCPRQQLVYRSEFSGAAGKPVSSPSSASSLPGRPRRRQCGLRQHRATGTAVGMPPFGTLFAVGAALPQRRVPSGWKCPLGPRITDGSAAPVGGLGRPEGYRRAR